MPQGRGGVEAGSLATLWWILVGCGGLGACVQIGSRGGLGGRDAAVGWREYVPTDVVGWAVLAGTDEETDG